MFELGKKIEVYNKFNDVIKKIKLIGQYI